MAYRLKHNDDVVTEWDTLPPMVAVPGVGHVHCIAPGWTSGDYRFETFDRSPPAAPSLDVVKAGLKSRVDDDAERTRLRYITPGSGMAMTYQEKHRQAEAVEDMGQTAANALSEHDRAAQFPTLAASVGIEALTLWECAALVIARYEAFAELSGVIEGTRLRGKKAIGDASDAAAARAAYEAITWPTP